MSLELLKTLKLEVYNSLSSQDQGFGVPCRCVLTSMTCKSIGGLIIVNAKRKLVVCTYVNYDE